MTMKGSKRAATAGLEHHISGAIPGSLLKQRDVIVNGDLDPAQQRSTGSGIGGEDSGHQTTKNKVESEIIIAPFHVHEPAVRLLTIVKFHHFQGYERRAETWVSNSKTEENHSFPFFFFSVFFFPFDPPSSSLLSNPKKKKILSSSPREAPFSSSFLPVYSHSYPLPSFLTNLTP